MHKERTRTLHFGKKDMRKVLAVFDEVEDGLNKLADGDVVYRPAAAIVLPALTRGRQFIEAKMAVRKDGRKPKRKKA